VFGRFARVPAIPTVVEQQDAETVLGERLGKRCAVRTVARVAIEDEHGGSAWA
jgi:hypothetical protein